MTDHYTIWALFYVDSNYGNGRLVAWWMGRDSSYHGGPATPKPSIAWVCEAISGSPATTYYGAQRATNGAMQIAIDVWNGKVGLWAGNCYKLVELKEGIVT